MTNRKILMPLTFSEAPAYIFNGINPDMNVSFIMNVTQFPVKKINRILRFLLVGRIPLSAGMLELITGYKGFKDIRNLKEGEILLLSNVWKLRTLKAISRIVRKGVRCFVYYSDSMCYAFEGKDINNVKRVINSCGFKIATFDLKDSQTYNFIFTPQFYRFPPKSAPKKIEYDFFFCGRADERTERILAMKEKLEKEGFRSKFILVHNDSEAIHYSEYIEYVEKSRCVIDIYRDQQVGFTRRPLEALFFDKKLLTCNQSIKGYDFFRKENIFVIGDDNLDNIKEFMDTPNVIVDEEIKRGYDVNSWLRKFMV